MVDDEKTVLMKLHSSLGQNILAICDPELLGEKFQWGEVVMLISKSFYGGEMVGIDIMLKTAAQCSSINAFGRTSVGALLDAGLVKKEAIVYINGVPHCQVYVI